MQTLTIGRSTYKLSPSRNVGELQTKLSKFTGKTKRTAIAKDRRYYPSFYAGQSTSEYVNAFYDGNALGPLKIFGQLSTKPCTLYSGADLHEIMTDNCADPAPNDPAPAAAAPTRYALVNRPAGLGTVPRGLEYQVDPRPQEGAPHHSMARHGILVCDRTLTDAECRSFELAPLIDGAAVDTIADTIAADLADYAAEYVTQSAEDTEEFSRAVLQRAARGALRVSIGDPAGLVSSVIYRLRAMAAPAANVTAPVELAAPVAAVFPSTVGEVFQNMRERTPLQYLPIFVRLAIEWIDSNSEMRNTQALDDMIDAYAKTYGASCDDADRKSAHHLCARRFGDFLVISADPAPVEIVAPVAADPAIIAPDTLREMNRAHGIASEQIRAIRSYCLSRPGSHVGDMLRAEADRYGRRSDDTESGPAWARIYRQVSDEFRAAAELDICAPTPPLPRVLYSKFIRSAGKREAPMTV